MTAPKDNPNVVDLQQRQPGTAATDRLGDLLKLVRGVSLKRINALVGTLFENVDDALFDLAERAGSNAVQTEYFDGMREVRKKRQLVERLFQDQATKAFTDFADGKLKAARTEVSPQPASGGLSLVDDTELEESLAVTSMVAKAENRLQRALYQVNQRLSVIIGGGKVEDNNNPIGPAVLGNAFRSAIREFEVNVQVKLIIYKLFDRYVMTGLEPIYDEVNVELIRAGVLPQVRHVAPTNKQPAPAAGVRLPPGAAAPAATTSAPTYYDPAADQLQAEIYHTLRSLLANRHGPEGHAGDAAVGGIGFSPTDLLSALTILQSQSAVAQARAESVADAAQAVQQIKRELLDQVNKLSGDAKDKRVSSADEDTIDLVGMLFEYILQDRNLPAQMQALFGRLQIPYLKVAILDKHLFAQKSHPARRLLDLLADAGKSWSEESDRDHRLYERIKACVETVLRDFDDDVGVFERELASFGDFIDQHKKRAELAEQRAADATRGREKLQAARRTAAREILKRIEDRNLPPVVHSVLSRPWANYLVLTVLRQGEESDEWKNALRFADEFVWSAQPKTTESEVTRLRALLPQLEKALRHGLATVAYHDSDVKQLMGELSLFYKRLLDGQKIETKTVKEVIAEQVTPATPGEDAEAPAPAVAATQSPVEEIVLGSSDAEGTAESEPAEPVEEDEFVQAVRAIKVGTWIEFIDENEQRERAKLSWISPISSKYLFVNRRGLKVCDKTVHGLAAELRRGSAVVLEEVPLFDRALDAIVARLRHAGDEAPATPPAPQAG
ncbi:DUF1631 domain-containing protein [Dokdonella fugitiva]|uniref:DUF1631 domain-containing protein n=1 Tax=Dokdonella fugitiva TaxID=328517 RepID=UPI0015FC3BB0|nr:DUF1631 domain-containing protein [Dokdonella fugitiva]MBA8884956.1 uncharacterized protein YukE [Dokdonella fugitiva]